MRNSIRFSLLTGLLAITLACTLFQSTQPAPASPASITDTPEPEPTSMPPQPSALPGTPFADAVRSFTQGPIPPGSLGTLGSDPDYVLGPPDAIISPCCSGLLTLGTGGSIEVEFTDNVALNGPGPDLSIIGDPENDEEFQVLVSMDGESWEDFGLVAENVTLDLDVLGLDYIRFVRVVDDGVPEASGNNSAELDAIEALHNGPPK